jgi:hypothetical protein
MFDAMVIITRVDDEFHILKSTTRANLDHRIANLIEAAVLHQCGDGSWDTDWFAGPDSRATSLNAPHGSSSINALLATGHMAEVFLHLRPELRPSDDVLMGAAAWLLSMLQVQDLMSRAKLAICPYSHAAAALMLLSHPLSPGDKNCNAANGSPPAETRSSR